MIETLESEFWITHEDKAVRADGDINHDAIACKFCAEKIAVQLRRFGHFITEQAAMIFEDAVCSDGMDIHQIRADIIDASDSWHREGEITQDQCDDPFEYLRERVGIKEDMWRIATDIDADGRLYMMQHHGWIAVRQHMIELWEWNHRMARRLAEGLETKYLDRVDQEKFHIEIRKEDLVIQEVPGPLISDVATVAIRRLGRESFA